MQVRTICPLACSMAPVRTSRTAPSCSRPTQVWQMPIRQPNGSVSAGVLAADQDRDAGVALRLGVGDPEAHRAAVAVTAADADDRLEPFGVQVFCAIGLLVELLDRVDELAGPGQERLALGPVGAQLVQLRRLEARLLGGVDLGELVSLDPAASWRSIRPKIMSSSERQLWMCTASLSSARRSSSRSMLMIGVMPLPAEMPAASWPASGRAA